MILASVLGIAVAGYAFAQDHPEHPEHPKKQAAEGQVVEATVVGENICLGCTLKKEKRAAAQCSKYGHRHALKVTSATASGKQMPKLKGWVLHYLDTDKSQPLVEGHHGETLTVTGKVYIEERVLEVDKLAKGKSEHPEHPKKGTSEHPEHPKKGKSEHPEHPKRGG